MGDFQVKKQPKKYDAVIVGSGAGGGMAAYMLANAGLKVCIIEAGFMYDPVKNVTQLKNPWDSPRRGASTKLRPFGDFDASYYGWDIPDEPFTKESGTDWMWWRARRALQDALAGFKCTQRPQDYSQDHWSNRAVEILHESEGCEGDPRLPKLPEDVRSFIERVTLHLQSNRSKKPEQHDAMFQEAYRLYCRYGVEVMGE